MTRTESHIVLLSITLCWASSYIFIKNLPSALSPLAYMTLTSGIASIIFVIVFFKKLREFKVKLLMHSAIMAVLVCGNLIFERLGIAEIPASTASFVASLNIVFVPLLLLMLKRKPTKNNLLGIALILIGLTLTSGVNPRFFSDPGVLFMVTACIFMSVYIIIVDNFTKKFDPLLLGVGQMFLTAIIAFVLWSIEEPGTFFTLDYTNEMLANIFLLAFFARAYAYIMLMYAQKYANPISVTVIASTEPVVTLVLAMLIPNAFGLTESFTLIKLYGAGFIVAGAICAGTNFLDNPGAFQKLKFWRDHRKGDVPLE
ncbi:DMT family transporter [Candidatus Contubernalis alkaliaceticus]|uniref:DMT family transporter n=1 Tax=Candidatus Contubernalis alkaliaceticus TaxID=338645 RepID=UPI001F4BCE2E|nr:DMT family transporter [Candidatus Contubernalis alkalaceticus]UNC93489.1 EamA family transporter [Candidatus Contubernalis alkalaceticus]